MTRFSKYKGIIQIGSVISIIGIASAVFSSLYWNSQASLGAEIKDIRSISQENKTDIAVLENKIDNIDKNVEDIKRILEEK